MPISLFPDCFCFTISLFLFLQQIFHKRMPPEAVDLVSRLLQYSPNLRCTAVSIAIFLYLDVVRYFLLPEFLASLH